MFFRNVDLISKDYMAICSRRQNSSLISSATFSYPLDLSGLKFVLPHLRYLTISAIERTIKNKHTIYMQIIKIYQQNCLILGVYYYNLIKCTISAYIPFQCVFLFHFVRVHVTFGQQGENVENIKSLDAM
jgi:hypothetical protein